MLLDLPPELTTYVASKLAQPVGVFACMRACSRLMNEASCDDVWHQLAKRDLLGELVEFYTREMNQEEPTGWFHLYRLYASLAAAPPVEVGSR